MTLSPSGERVVRRLVELLRKEFRDGLRDRHRIDDFLEWLQPQLDELPTEETRRVNTALKPLLRGYSALGRGEREHSLVSAGQELARLLGTSPVTETASPSQAPTAQKAALRLDSEIQFLKGVGPQLALRLNKLDIRTVEDLIHHVPRRHEDRSQVRPIGQLRHGAAETVKGRLGTPRSKTPRTGLSILQIPLTDTTGTLLLTWFNQPYLAKQLRPGQEVLAHGKVEVGYGESQMQSPELETVGESINAGRLVPVYPLTGNLHQKTIRKIQFAAVPTYAPLVKDPLPASVVSGFPARDKALIQYHWPDDYTRKDQARRRLAFEELFLLQVELAEQRKTREMEPRLFDYRLDLDLTGSFVELLPFEPTGAQRRVMGQILEDLRRETPMNRLLQGDVGAGKTVVAAFAAWTALKSGYQAAIMAPTEILAAQHGEKLAQLLEPAGISVARLSGSLKKKQKQELYERLRTNDLRLVVGTHALIQQGVEFHKLGMVVVDEQHKFGVMQRTTLRQKGSNPDLLVMTATPIPRTLALTLYGDLEVSKLDELPPGRQPIRSESVPFSERKRVYEEIRAQINEGRQAYIICPLVEETEKVEATAAVEEAETLRSRVFPEFSVGLLHGRMKAAEKEAVMEQFRRGEHHILISTTVIEVGVDVPNATFMLVQDANRFGLAQLHQLRGRVGRGKHASRCIFMGDAKSEDSARRLRAIARLSDGFDVAEEDLQIRGPGDFYGMRQSGFPEFKVADLLRDQDLLEEARRAAERVVAMDPRLEWREHQNLKLKLEQRNVRTAELVH